MPGENPPRRGPSAAVRTPGASGLVLFVSSEPFLDAIPDGRHPVVSAAATGTGSVLSGRWGGHEPADFEGDQMYGPDARIGRMVLEIARKRGAAVTVVDVNRPGEAADLVRTYLQPDDVYPVLVRADGARLVGSDAFVPAAVERFVSGL